MHACVYTHCTCTSYALKSQCACDVSHAHWLLYILRARSRLEVEPNRTWIRFWIWFSKSKTNLIYICRYLQLKIN